MQFVSPAIAGFYKEALLPRHNGSSGNSRCTSSDFRVGGRRDQRRRRRISEVVARANHLEILTLRFERAKKDALCARSSKQRRKADIGLLTAGRNLKRHTYDPRVRLLLEAQIAEIEARFLSPVFA